MRFTIGKFDYSIEFEYKHDSALWRQSCIRNGIIDRRFIAEQALACATSANIIMNREDAVRSIEAHLESLDQISPPALTQPNVTVCRILRGAHGASTKDMTPYLEGRAVRSVLDTFVKESGRKVALANALSKSATNRHKPSRIFRYAAWAAFEHRNGWLIKAHIDGAISRSAITPSAIVSKQPQPQCNPSSIGFYAPKRSGLLSASQS